MDELVQNAKTWAPILIPLLALLAGTGWLQYFLSLRREKHEKYRAIVEEFLLPFEGLLRDNYQVFNELRDDRELANLEYHPSSLQQYFASLPNDDPRKVLWKSRVERLQESNRRAIELINKFRGRIITNDLKTSLNDFVYHAQKWEDMWKALTGSGPVPASLDQPGVLYAPKFPATLEPALKSEIDEVKRRAGYKN